MYKIYKCPYIMQRESLCISPLFFLYQETAGLELRGQGRTLSKPGSSSVQRDAPCNTRLSVLRSFSPAKRPWQLQDPQRSVPLPHLSPHQLLPAHMLCL